MGLFDWFKENTEEQENTIIVKTLKSKGNGKHPVLVTVGDIKKGIALDANGYPNEVVLFLRLNKKDR